MTERKAIAFFDFDGTITRKDTMLEFIRFTKGNLAYLAGMLMNSPWLIGLKTGLIPAAKAKEKLLTYFFKGTPLNKFNEMCRDFSNKKLQSFIRIDASNAIAQHKERGDLVVVVSASAENWIRYWCESEGLEYVGTRLCIENGNITGTLEGNNCNGAEKVSRIMYKYDPADYNEIYCYGDSKGDREMLKLATHPYYRHFKR